MSVLYKVEYKLNKCEGISYPYIGLSGFTTLLFNDIIQINPHNLYIVIVSAIYRNFMGGYDSILLYNNSWTETSSIWRIKKHINDRVSNQKITDELYHVVDLWLTKFVPYK